MAFSYVLLEHQVGDEFLETKIWEDQNNDSRL